ncbi:MAG: 8-oxo-dGTP diphosphatase MutT [Coxiellaceae bacterium]|nr:8-oxo-dGTP diphosphatase MutT [Coxiellaceae bacterium]
MNDKTPPAYLHVVVGILCNEKKEILIALRPPQVVSPGFWEFPGGKVELNETLENALIREFREEVGIDVTQVTFFLKIEKAYPDKILVLNVFHIHEFSGIPVGCENQEVRFVSSDALKDYSFLPANAEIIERLQYKASVVPGECLKNR